MATGLQVEVVTHLVWQTVSNSWPVLRLGEITFEQLFRRHVRFVKRKSENSQKCVERITNLPWETVL